MAGAGACHLVFAPGKDKGILVKTPRERLS